MNEEAMKWNEGGRHYGARDEAGSTMRIIARKHGVKRKSTYKGRRSREEAMMKKRMKTDIVRKRIIVLATVYPRVAAAMMKVPTRGAVPVKKNMMKTAMKDDYDDGYEDDYYDEDDDDRGSPWFKIVLVILCAIIIACVLYLARGPIGNLLQLNDHQDDHQQQSSMISDDEPEPPQNPDDITPIVPER